MPGNYAKTHVNILESAKKLFLENGYERTNLREICSGASVTVGAFYNHFNDKESLFTALVKPCVDGINKIYKSSEESCFEKISSDELMKVWEISRNAIKDFINYIYDNFESFQLILLHSDGTPYSNFVEELVSIEVKESIRFFEELQKQGFCVVVPTEKVIHMLSHCYFASVFECVTHNYTKQEAIESVDYLISFFNAGWKNILKFNF